MKIVIADNYASMSETAARLVISEIKKNKAAVLGLPAGGTPLGLYKNLVKAVINQSVSFRQARAFQLDEYAGLAQTDKLSFGYFLEAKLFSRGDFQGENIFKLNGQAEDLKKECARYEGLTQKQGGFDLIVLGIGQNGHIAFNEPGSALNSKTRVVGLAPKTRLASAGTFGGLNKVPRQAITIGLATIMKARKVILMASGRHKAKIIKRALAREITKAAPASILRTHKNFTVILDQEAAGDLAQARVKY